MIQFLGEGENGDVIVEVMDWSRRFKGPVRLTFRPIEEGETCSLYFDKIMNKYWWETGKNKRKYHDIT